MSWLSIGDVSTSPIPCCSRRASRISKSVGLGMSSMCKLVKSVNSSSVHVRTMKKESALHSRGTSRRSPPSVSQAALRKRTETLSSICRRDRLRQCARQSRLGLPKAPQRLSLNRPSLACVMAALAPAMEANARNRILASSQLVDKADLSSSSFEITKTRVFGGSSTKPTSRDTMRRKFRSNSCCSSSIWPLSSTSSSASSSCTATLSSTALCCLIASAKPRLV
mmetsp:Transcript_24832/g.57690  ORF Transcript_24832/g.57690 Transcript_24832/m.57690 type:complete len:224 (-) Transcript_24832:1293-1964(-)